MDQTPWCLVGNGCTSITINTVEGLGFRVDVLVLPLLCFSVILVISTIITIGKGKGAAGTLNGD